MTVEIRRAAPSDAAGLTALQREVADEPDGWLLDPRPGRRVGDERRYLRAVRRHPDAAVFVAVDGDRVVGRLSLARDPHPASAHVADLGVMVAISHRRRGIGRRLLDEAIAWARGAGVCKLELHVFPWNTAAVSLYERAGFVREGYRTGHYRRAGAEVDAILMALHLERKTAA